MCSMLRGNKLHRAGQGIFIGLTALSVLLAPAVAAAEPVLAIDVPKGLAVAQIKMTGDEFIVLKNNSGAPISDLANYWLYAYNKTDPMAAGVGSSSQQLPAGTLADGQTLLLSDNGMATCGAAMAGKLSLSFTDSGGFVQLAKASMQNGAVVQTVSDTVSWSSGTDGTIQKVPSASKQPDALWYRFQKTDGSGGYGWQQATLDPVGSCTYNVAVASGVQPLSAVTLASASSMPPVTILAAPAEFDETAAQTGAIPAADSGLQPPLINELLPNPASPSSDNTDEYIELYNPNSSAFDLSGFMLQAASTTSASAKAYTFPAGTILGPRGFHAFASEQTHLSLSNSGGQTWLLDPAGQVLGQSAPYGTAKDGYTWAMANGAWSWSTQATPGTANTIRPPAAKSTKTAAASTKTAVSKKQAGAVKGLTTVAKTGAVTTNAQAQPDSEGVSLHGSVLAVVAILAVLYAGYEYRHDIFNRVHKLRRHRSVRALARQ